MSEEWRSVVGYEGRYEVSSLGRVRSVPRRARNRNGTRSVPGRVLALTPMNAGYLACGLHSDGKYAGRLAHRVVAEAFLGPIPNGREVNHKNGVKTDNRAGNLEYMTRRENLQHAKRLGLLDNEGERNPMAKLTAEQVLQIRSRYRFGGGPGYKALAAEYGVTWEAVRNLIKGQSWASTT